LEYWLRKKLIKPILPKCLNKENYFYSKLTWLKTLNREAILSKLLIQRESGLVQTKSLRSHIAEDFQIICLQK
jgi:hypothetical protein